MGRRKVRLAHEFAAQPEVASVLYVEPPVQTSVLDLVRGRFEPGHLGESRARHRDALIGRCRRASQRLWVYTGSTKTVPLTCYGSIRRLRFLNRINRQVYLGLIRRCLKKLPGRRLLLWLTYPLQAAFMDAFPERELLCYDWTDDWTAFDVLPTEDPQELHDLNDRLVREADLVLAVSEELQRRAQALNRNVHRVPNATDVAVLNAASVDGPVAPELMGLPHPLIGYVGQIADKMDYQLIGELATARPDWSFVFVGAVWETRRREVDSLSALPNVHFLGFRPFQDLPAFLRGFDVCILPHRRSRLTLSMDPIKLYDYLAAGKPIVSTSVAGVDRFADVIRVADGVPAFVSALEQALSEDGVLCGRRLAYARGNSWPVRAAEVWELVRSNLAARGVA